MAEIRQKGTSSYPITTEETILQNHQPNSEKSVDDCKTENETHVKEASKKK